MKLFAASIIYLFGILGGPNSNDVRQILDGYIHWTQTGKAHVSNVIFEEKVDFTYQVAGDEFESTPFSEYQSKVESAATSVPRTMAVTHFNLSGNKATAYLTDVSTEGDFSLVHVLCLRKRKNEWRINAVKIMAGS